MMEDDADDDSTDGKYAELGKKGQPLLYKFYCI